MRIVAGRHKGRALTPLGKGDAAAHLRPTTDRVRESLFSVLLGGRFGSGIEGQHVLDLFAGTGALGFEAISRGAAHVTFVDDGYRAQRLIRANAALLGETERVTILGCAADRLPRAGAEGCGLVFLDPPYGKGLGEPALLHALSRGWLAPEALVVWEETKPQVAPPGLDLIETRRYGDTHITFLEAPAFAPGGAT